jgi:hypothetical protein
MAEIDLTKLSDVEKENLLAEVEKGQQLAGHFPDAEDMDRVNRILSGKITIEEAYAEVDAQYR